jgi:hypothetical protein
MAISRALRIGKKLGAPAGEQGELDSSAAVIMARIVDSLERE